MTDLLIRDVRDEVLAALDARAGSLGLIAKITGQPTERLVQR